MYSLIDVSINLQSKMLAGWAVISIITANIVYNIARAALLSLKKIKVLGMRYRRDRTIDKRREKIAQVRRQIVKKYPGQFPGFEYYLEERDAIKKCKDWINQRDWLQSNEIEFY
jgi:hypothetical protein